MLFCNGMVSMLERVVVFVFGWMFGWVHVLYVICFQDYSR